MSDVCLAAVMSVCLFVGWIGLFVMTRATARYLLIEPVRRWMGRREQWLATQDEVESMEAAS